MPVSEAQKRASAKWQKANTKNLSCNVSIAEHALFKTYAERQGKTICGMLLQYVRGCIAEERRLEEEEQKRGEI